MIRPVERQQTGFCAYEGDGVRSAYAASVDAAGVCIQAAGDVNGEHGCIAVVNGGNPLGVAAFKVACEADAEQAVHYKPAVTCVWHVVNGCAACSQPAGVRLGRVRRKFCHVARENHCDHKEPLLEIARNHKSITAVVAGAGENQNGFASSSGKLACQLRSRQAGALHQRHVVVMRFNAADVGC